MFIDGVFENRWFLLCLLRLDVYFHTTSCAYHGDNNDENVILLIDYGKCRRWFLEGENFLQLPVESPAGLENSYFIGKTARSGKDNFASTKC